MQDFFFTHQVLCCLLFLEYLNNYIDEDPSVRRSIQSLKNIPQLSKLVDDMILDYDRIFSAFEKWYAFFFVPLCEIKYFTQRHKEARSKQSIRKLFYFICLRIFLFYDWFFEFDRFTLLLFFPHP